MEKQTPCREPDAGLDPRILGSRPKLGADTQPLSHPGVPRRERINFKWEILSPSSPVISKKWRLWRKIRPVIGNKALFFFFLPHIKAVAANIPSVFRSSDLSTSPGTGQTLNKCSLSRDSNLKSQKKDNKTLDYFSIILQKYEKDFLK